MTDTRRIAETLPSGSALSTSTRSTAAPTIFVLGPSEDATTKLGEVVASALLSRSRPAASPAVLSAHCRAMLSALGASLEHPPGPDSLGDDEVLDGLVQEAAQSLAGITTDGPVVLHQAGLSVVFDLWRQAAERAVCLVVIESPSVLVERTRAKDNNAIEALARYERVLHNLLRQVEGLPVFICHLDEARRRGHETAGQLVAFLSDNALEVDSSVVGRLGELWTGESTEEISPSSEIVLDEIDVLYRTLSKLHGAHDCFARVEGLTESAWSREVLRLSNELSQVLAGLLWTTRQIEPIVRAQPSGDWPNERSDSDEPAEDANEYDENGPYPLNAGEDRRAYHRWLSAHRLPIVIGAVDEPVRTKARTRPRRLARNRPLISVLVPVWRTPLWALQRCVASVLAQDFASWQLCICDDASGDDELTDYLKRLNRVDRRISVVALNENGGISAATNAALAVAKGEFVAFLDHDDELTPNALSAVAEAIAANRDADVFYSDEDKIDAAGERFDPAFKPEWSPDLLLSFAYLCHLTVIRRSLVNDMGGLRSDFDGSQDFDLSLRATERARAIVHIPRVLYHWRTLPGSAATDSAGAIAKPWAYEAGHRAIEDALARRGEAGEVTAVLGFPGRYHVRRALTAAPLVSIIIPFRDEPALLATCATSLRADPGYRNLELVLVDNGSELPETEALLERLGNEDGVRILRAPGPFNWAAINNSAAKEARGEVLLFANNDIEARTSRWLDALLGHALRKEVGAVGARLVYPDGAIQHAGVVIGLGGIAGHVLRGLPGEHPGYGSMAIQTRNCSVVTGACMMTRAEVFSSVGGFDEHLPVAFNDVDYCLKLRQAGYLVVYTPLAELVHHESRSRGHTDDLAESKLILRRWVDDIAVGDPYMNINLSHWRYWCPLSTAQEDERWKDYLKTSVSTRGSSSST